MNHWTAPIPVYVTRKDAGGDIGSITMGAWAILPALILVYINVVIWSVVGIYEAARLVS